MPNDRVPNERAIKRAREDKRSRDLAGQWYDSLLSDREFAISCLDSSNSSLQEVAINLFSYYWPPDPIAEELLEELAATTNRTQKDAIVALANIRGKLYGTKISATLGEYALDESLPYATRFEIYRLLRLQFPLVKLPPAKHLESIYGSNQIREIDEDLVRQCILKDNVSHLIAKRQLDSREISSIEKYKLGKSLLLARQHERAIECFTDSLTDWKIPGPLLARARAYTEMGKYDLAVLDCTSAIELMPHVPRFYRRRAIVHRAMGNAKKADADETRAFELDHRHDEEFWRI